MSLAICYVDGGCSNNNVGGWYGQMSYCFVINGKVFIRKLKRIGSNNLAELFGLVKLLETLKKRKINEAIIYTDSQVLVSWWTRNKVKRGDFREERKKLLTRLHLLKKSGRFLLQWTSRQNNLAGIELDFAKKQFLI